MKSFKVLKAILLIAVAVSGLIADIKRYEIKSGIIEYTTNGSTNIMGMTSKTIGESKLIFKDWGNFERHEEKSTTTTMGQTESDHEIMIVKDGKFYAVDFEEKIIIETDPEALAKMGKQDMQQMGKDMMIKMGGKKVGNEKVLGFKCDIWEIMGSKTWIYKGVPLKTEANIMGTTHLQIATKAKFNVSISDKEFVLPDFPKKTMQQMIQEQMQDHGMPHQGANMPTQMPSPEEMQEMMKNLGGMLGGAK